MHSLIEQLLAKRGIKGYEDLKAEERKQYDIWTAVLNKPDFTIEDLKAFLPKEIERVSAELRKWDNNEKRELYYKAVLRNLEILTLLITTPEKQRQEQRAQIEQLLQN
jgi:hypothetical protein